MLSLSLGKVDKALRIFRFQEPAFIHTPFLRGWGVGALQTACSDETTAGRALGRLVGRGSQLGEAQIP